MGRKMDAILNGLSTKNRPIAEKLLRKKPNLKTSYGFLTLFSTALLIDPRMYRIAVCHHTYNRWYHQCNALGFRYLIARTMVETDRLVSEHIERCLQMDEVR